LFGAKKALSLLGNMADALVVSHLRKTYKEHVAVSDMSFAVREGEFFGFLGPNGAGKTTTIHCITGINTVQGGVITVCGHDVVKEYREARRHVGLSPQEFNIDIFASAEKILWYVAGYYGIAKQDRKKRMAHLFEILDLAAHKDKPFRALSGGQKRRVMLARAMVHNPELLILDEPTAGVDVELRRELWEYLRKINSEGKTIILTSHYLEEVELLCQRIAIVQGGAIVKIGSKEEFIAGGKKLEDAYMDIVSRHNTRTV
jgi:ABC-2 type transport system ATP-binding protein